MFSNYVDGPRNFYCVFDDRKFEMPLKRRQSFRTSRRRLSKWVRLLEPMNDMAVVKTLLIMGENFDYRRESEEKIFRMSSSIFPKLHQCLRDKNCYKFRPRILRLIRIYLSDRYFITKRAFNLRRFLAQVTKFLLDDRPKVHREMTAMFGTLVFNKEHALSPHLRLVVVYMLMEDRLNDHTVTLNVLNFWKVLIKRRESKELLRPYSDLLFAQLMKCFRYREGVRLGGDVRTNAASVLRALAARFGPDIQVVAVPFINEYLIDWDPFIRESTFFALECILQENKAAFVAYHPFLANQVTTTMRRDSWSKARATAIRVAVRIVCPRNCRKIVVSLMGALSDDDRGVRRNAQCAAIFLLRRLDEKDLSRWREPIVGRLDRAMRARPPSKKLYQVIWAVARRGCFSTALTRRMTNRFFVYPHERPWIITCLTAVNVPAVQSFMMPLAERIFSYCLGRIDPRLGTTTSQTMNDSYVVLRALIVRLKVRFVDLMNGSDFLVLLQIGMTSISVKTRIKAIAVFRALMSHCFGSLIPELVKFVEILAINLDVTRGKEKPCIEAARAIITLALIAKRKFRLYAAIVLLRCIQVLEILKEQVDRPLYRLIAITFCVTLCVILSSIRIIKGDGQITWVVVTSATSEPIMPGLEILMKNCCYSLRNHKDSLCKDMAYRGICKLSVLLPGFLRRHFGFFCDAMASWKKRPSTYLIFTVREIFEKFREKCGEPRWKAFMIACPDRLRRKLNLLYGF